MKKYNSIDDFFKEGVADYQVMPSDKVWKNIESEYFKVNNAGKRNAMIWALASLLLITGSIITWTMLTNNTEQSSLASHNGEEMVAAKSIDMAETKMETNTINEESPNITDNIGQAVETNDFTVDEETGNESIDLYNNQPKLNNDLLASIKPGLSLIGTNQMNTLKHRSIYSVESSAPGSMIERHEPKIIVDYLKKRKNLHFYTGASTSIAMVYYPTTTDQPTWTADLVYGLKLKRCYMETGIGFQKMKERGNFQIGYRTNDSIGYYNKVTSFELNPENPNEITFKTTTTTVYDSIDHHLLQSPLYYYDYIVFPVKFGYKFHQKEQFSVSAEAGIIYSFLTKTYVPEVQFNDPESQLIGITNNTPERAEHNFRVHVALRFNYNVTKTVSLSAQPEFTKFLNSIYKPSYNTTARPYTMGIRFGVCFDF